MVLQARVVLKVAYFTSPSQSRPLSYSPFLSLPFSRPTLALASISLLLTLNPIHATCLSLSLSLISLSPSPSCLSPSLPHVSPSLFLMSLSPSPSCLSLPLPHVSLPLPLTFFSHHDGRCCSKTCVTLQLSLWLPRSYPYRRSVPSSRCPHWSSGDAVSGWHPVQTSSGRAVARC